MIFGQDREELRKMYADAWQKRCDSLPMSPPKVLAALDDRDEQEL